MQVCKNNELQLPSSIITIGAFDGLHLGHQSLIKRAVKRAEEKGVPSVVYTFDPPPRTFFGNELILTSIGEKIALLSKYGVDYVVIASFDGTYASRAPIHFIKEIEHLHPLEVIVGSNFSFGKQKQGDVHFLAHYLNVAIQPFVSCDKGDTISSTRIRELMHENKMEQVRYLLGRKNLEKIKL